jgi:outer membrane protein OmpA-like peptidoglycan-associated protein
MIGKGGGAQARYDDRAARLGRLRRAGALALGAVTLTGCASGPSLNPVDWWHALQGGPIARERPAPPGADAAFPNLATVPPRPEPPDREAMRRLTDSLIGDRSNAQYTAEAAPLGDPSLPSASPRLFGAGTLPPPGPAAPPRPTPTTAPALSASLPAASAQAQTPAAPATPPSPAPRGLVARENLAPPETAAPPPEAAPAAPAASSAETTRTETPPPRSAPTAPRAEETLPALPTAPPPRAAAAPPAPPPVAQTPAPTPIPGGGGMIGFAPGSSTLPPEAAAQLREFVAGRGGRAVAVTGYGDAISADAGAQTAALSLALARAQAVTNALTAAGVPRAVISLGAEASGRGAALRLLQ